MARLSFRDLVYLVSGTSIGAGMLTMPQGVGRAGFASYVVVQSGMLALSWLSGMQLWQLSRWTPGREPQLASIAHHFLGRAGWGVVAVLWIMMGNTLLIAYLGALAALLPQTLATPLRVGVVALAVAAVLLRASVDGAMRWVMRLLISSFACLVYLTAGGLSPERLGWGGVEATWLLLPVVGSAFGFQNVVPSAAGRFSGGGAQFGYAVALGLVLPALLYTVWNLLILGRWGDALLELGPAGLLAAVRDSSHDVGWAALALHLFSAAALLTSVLGIAPALADFYGDLRGQKGQNERSNQLWAIGVPTLWAAVAGSNFTFFFAIGAGLVHGILNLAMPGVCVAMARRQRLASEVSSWLGHPLVLAGQAAGVVVFVAAVMVWMFVPAAVSQ